MSHNITSLHSIEDLNQALEESKQRPILIFKHSATCPISSRALREFHKYLETADVTVTYNLITVQTDRPVSNEVAARLEVQHETPQAIIVKNGKSIWDASHFSINASAIDAAIRQLNL